MAAGNTGRSRLALALLAATMLTPLNSAQAAPGDPLGAEFQVNSYTTDYQHWPAIAADAAGDFVVAWISNGQDGGDAGIYARRYTAAGYPADGEFLVNSTTAGGQAYPTVAMDADGDFVVAWSSYGQDGSQWGLYAQRYNAAGVPQGGEFRVGSLAPVQVLPAVAMNDAGDFVVAWQAEDSSDYGIFARLYNALGEAQGAEFQVNTTESGRQSEPAMAMDADGDFVVTWTSNVTSYPTGYDILGQRFDAAGAPRGSEFRVNEVISGRQVRQAVAMDADGDFVVAWEDDSQDGSYAGVFARRFDAGGVARGGEFQVNTTTMDQQSDPAVAMDADGDFVVTWMSYGQGVYAQRYNAAGLPRGGEFPVSTAMAYSVNPAVAMESGGDFAIAWVGPDGDVSGIFGRRFEGPGREVASDFDADGMSDIPWRNLGTGSAVIWQMDGFTTSAASSIGAPDTAWRVEDIGDFDGDGRADILWRHTDGRTVIWQMDGFTRTDDAQIGTVDTAWAVEGLADFDGDGRDDILWRHSDGRTAIWLMNGLAFVEGRTIGMPSGAWRIAGLGDFNGDGRADILWHNTADGRAVVWQMNGLVLEAGMTIGKPPTAWAVEGLADFDGSGRPDILWRHSDGGAAVWQMNGYVREASAGIGTVDGAWQVVRLGDHNGDGRADILWRHSDGRAAIWQMNGTTREGSRTYGPFAGWEVR